MASPDAEQVREWLITRFNESSCMELVAEESIKILCEKSSQYFYKDGVLESGDLAKWLITEFDVPDKEVYALLEKLKEEGVAMEIRVLLPGESSPSEPLAPQKQAGVKTAQPSGPQPKDISSDLSGFLHDRTYLEWTILEHARGDFHSEVPVVSMCLQSDFQLTEEERTLLLSEELIPGGAEDTAAGWVLRINGLALACACAGSISDFDDKRELREWARAVYKLQGNFGQLISRILGKRKQVNQEGCEDEATALEAAWLRFNRLYEGLKSDYSRIIASAKAGPAPAERLAQTAKPPSDSKAKKAPPTAASDSASAGAAKGSAIKLYLSILAALLVVVGGGAYVLFELGLLDAGGEPIDVDLSSLTVEVTNVLQSEEEMIVKVESSSWETLSRQAKEAELESMYSAALEQGLSVVRVVSDNGNPLSHVIDQNNYIIFR